MAGPSGRSIAEAARTWAAAWAILSSSYSPTGGADCAISFSNTARGCIAKVRATAGESGPVWLPHHELMGTREKLAAGSAAVAAPVSAPPAASCSSRRRSGSNMAVTV